MVEENRVVVGDILDTEVLAQKMNEMRMAVAAVVVVHDACRVCSNEMAGEVDLRDDEKVVEVEAVHGGGGHRDEVAHGDLRDDARGSDDRDDDHGDVRDDGHGDVYHRNEGVDHGLVNGTVHLRREHVHHVTDCPPKWPVTKNSTMQWDLMDQSSNLGT